MGKINDIFIFKDMYIFLYICQKSLGNNKIHVNSLPCIHEPLDKRTDLADFSSTDYIYEHLSFQVNNK